MSVLAKRIVTRIARIGEVATDDPDLRLRKSMMVLCAFPFVFAGLAWGLMYAFLGEPLSGGIPFSYGIISLLSILHFAATRRYRFFRFSQLTLILLLPFLLMVSLGGFIDGSAVVLWAFICPIGALLFEEPRNAPRWFLAFLGLVVLSGFLQPLLTFSNDLSPAAIIFFFVDSNRRPAGLGHINYAPIAAALKEIGYDKYASAEAFPYPDPDAAAAQTMAAYNEYLKG